MVDPFRWLSPLGISVALFLTIGTIWVLVGALTVPFHHRGADAQIVFVSNRTDTAFFGAPPSQLLGSDPALSKFRSLMFTVMSGLLLLAGTLFISLAWFGLRERSEWALVSLSVAGLSAIIFWAIALLPYFRAGIRVTFGDGPPFMWIPALLILPAIILGWIGLG